MPRSLPLQNHIDFVRYPTGAHCADVHLQNSSEQPCRSTIGIFTVSMLSTAGSRGCRVVHGDASLECDHFVDCLLRDFWTVDTRQPSRGARVRSFGRAFQDILATDAIGPVSSVVSHRQQERYALWYPMTNQRNRHEPHQQDTLQHRSSMDVINLAVSEKEKRAVYDQHIPFDGHSHGKITRDVSVQE